MKRIRVIIPDNESGIFYNVEDLNSVLYMEKEEIRNCLKEKITKCTE